MLMLYPTAHTSLADTAVTPFRAGSPDARLGLGTMLQAVPFQCSISVWVPEYPTAHTSLADIAATPVKLLGPDLGVRTGDNAPCRAVPVLHQRLKSQGRRRTPPTAHTSFVDTAATPFNLFDCIPELGLATYSNCTEHDVAVAVTVCV